MQPIKTLEQLQHDHLDARFRAKRVLLNASTIMEYSTEQKVNKKKVKIAHPILITKALKWMHIKRRYLKKYMQQNNYDVSPIQRIELLIKDNEKIDNMHDTIVGWVIKYGAEKVLIKLFSEGSHNTILKDKEFIDKKYYTKRVYVPIWKLRELKAIPYAPSFHPLCENNDVRFLGTFDDLVRIVDRYFNEQITKEYHRQNSR